MIPPTIIRLRILRRDFKTLGGTIDNGLYLGWRIASLWIETLRSVHPTRYPPS